MSDIAKRWKYYHHPLKTHNQYSKAITMKQVLEDASLGDAWDFFDPDTGTCVYRSKKFGGKGLTFSTGTSTSRMRRALLCGALVATLAGCSVKVPDNLVRPEHIEFATQTCTTNGGLKWIKPWSYSACFTCNNGLWGVVPEIKP